MGLTVSIRSADRRILKAVFPNILDTKTAYKQVLDIAEALSYIHLRISPDCLEGNKALTECISLFKHIGCKPKIEASSADSFYSYLSEDLVGIRDTLYCELDIADKCNVDGLFRIIDSYSRFNVSQRLHRKASSLSRLSYNELKQLGDAVRIGKFMVGEACYSCVTA